jgi:hypothetical protein
MSNDGAALRAAVPMSNARAEASRRNGARSKGPKSPEGKARAAQNALEHGMRATKHVMLPQEDGAEFAALETAVLAELVPVGALQTLLARRVAIAAWRLARADRMEAEALEFRSYDGANPGLALIRDGNATRSLETLLCYRAAAMAELARAQDAQGAPGRAGGASNDRPGSFAERTRAPHGIRAFRTTHGRPRPARDRGARARAAAPTRAAPEHRPSAPTERTRAPARVGTCAPSGVRPARPTRAWRYPARARHPLDAERTRAGTSAAAGAGVADLARGSSGRSCERRRAHTIGSGRCRRAPDSA